MAEPHKITFSSGNIGVGPSFEEFFIIRRNYAI